jgi:hypothetical protein
MFDCFEFITSTLVNWARDDSINRNTFNSDDSQCLTS